jgi:NDMA-dependent alcohol dehydrogenase
MKCKAAVIHAIGQDWSVEEIEVDPPKAGEVLVRWTHAGLCHSDEHVYTGDFDPPAEAKEMMGIESIYPMIGGHEGAGIVTQVGEGVRSVAVGDHVSASFVPACGTCRYCSTGRQNLCDDGAGAFLPGMITDGTSRHRTADGKDLMLLAKLGTFSEYSCVAESQVIKVDPDLPLDRVCLVSCGVATGWGSATKRGNVRPGDTVVVVGCGGIGMNAIQGAAMAGAKRVVAVDPVEMKREKAMEFGATDTFASMEEALAPVTDMTFGTMAEVVIMTPGVLYGDLMNLATKLTAKGGTVVATAIAPLSQESADINLSELTLWQKEVKGAIFGSLNPRFDIPNLLSMYTAGTLKLDELISATYPLEEINEGYRAMRDGENIRGVIEHAAG